MNTKKNKKSFLSILLSILLVLTIIAMGGGIIAPNLAGKKNTVEAPENGSTISAEAASITYPTDAGSNGFGQFPNGYTYYYTDKDLYLDYHNGTGASDLTKVTVDTVTANSHGTKTNPYVIANTTDWGNFVAYVMSDTNVWGGGKFFALADDLNFSGKTFRALGFFSGTFYGLGHIISDITTDFSNVGVTANSAAGTWGYGLICRAYNATVTDLVVKDFTYQNFTQGYKTHNERGSAVGGVVGYASGNDYVLNCHTNGTVQSATQYTCHVPVGGIIGAAYNGQAYATSATTTTSTYVYRCSSQLSVSVYTDGVRHVIVPAGIVGENYYCRNATYIYDCAANLTVPDTTGSYGVYASVGHAITGGGASVYIDGLVGRVEFTLASSADAKATFGGAATGVFNKTVKASMTLRNVYVEGVVKSGSTSKYMGASCGDTALANFSTRTLSQVYHTSGITGGVDNYAAYNADSVNQTAESAKLTALSDLLTAATNAVGTGSTKLNEKIWNASRIGTTSLNYKPESSPVRNYLMVAPKNIEWEYTGNDLKSKISEESWYADSVHGDDNIMTVVAPTMLNANTYTVGFTKKISDYVWSDGTTDTTKTITVTVKKKKLTFEWDSTSGVTEAKITGGLINSDKSNPPTITNTYYQMNGETVGAKLSGRPTTIGTYKVVASLPEDSNYRLKDEGKEDPWTIFILSALPVATPTVSGSREKDYDGSEHVFTLANADEMGAQTDGKKIQDEPVEITTGATYIKEADGTRKILIKNVGIYFIKFGLHDQTNNCWGEGGGVLRLEVKPRALTLTPARGGGWENFETNTNETFTITHNAVTGDIIQYAITYVKPDDTTVITVGSDKLKQDEENPNKTTVTLDPLDTGVHKLRIGLAPSSASNANGNYVLSNPDLTEDGFIEKEFTVNGKVVNIQDSDIVWQYSDGNIDGEFESDTNLEYNGRRFTVTIKEDGLAAMGVRVKEYVNSDRDNSANTDIGLNAGKYKTKVVLTKLNDTYKFTDTPFEFDWEISKTIFDLSKVKWDYTDPIGYTGKPIKVQLTNVPSLLTATYLNNIETQVNDGTGEYTATVSFKPKNEADKDNYVVPSGDAVQGGVVKYKYDGGTSFPWTLKWKIVQGVIDINWDLDGKETKGANEYLYSYPTLLGGGDNVEYMLYKEVESPVGSGNMVKASTSTAFNAVTEPAEHTKEWYYVVASLKSTAASNFKFGEGTPELRFAVGDYRDAVTVTATGGGMYNGKPQPITFTHNELSDSDFKVTYLTDEGVALSGPPTNVGNYVARISVIDSKADSYYVVGRSYAFEITQLVIDTSTLKWDYTTPYQFVRDKNGEHLYTVTLAGIPATLNLVYTNNSFSAAGEYTATVTFDNDSIDDEIRANIDLSVFWNAGTNSYEIPSSVNTLSWKIEKHTLTKPNSSSGHTYGKTFKLPDLIGLDPDWANYLTLSVKKGTEVIDLENVDYSVVNAGTYYITCTPIGSLRDSVKWSDGGTVDKTVTVKIDPLYVKVIGWEDKPAVAKFGNDGEGFSFTTIVYKGADGREIPASEVNTTYDEEITATVVVLPEMAGNVYIDYDDGVEMSCKFRMFAGQATPVDLPVLAKAQLEYNFETQTFVIKNWKDIRDYVTILGATSSYNPLTVSGDFIGKRTVKVALKSDQNVAWKGVDPNKRFEIIPLTIEVIPGTLPQIWEWNEERGRYVLSAVEDFDISTIVDYEYYDTEDMPANPDKLKEGAKYKAIALIKDEYKEYFCFGMKDGENNNKVPILSSEERLFTYGEDGSASTKPGDKPGDNTISGLPLWQLIVGGVSALLFVFCTLKAFGEYSRAKACKREAKELAAQSYAVNYGFVPLPLLAMGAGVKFLGLEETPWTIIALVAVGLFLISAVVLFMMKKKRKAAELLLKREQMRIAEEKEYAREEERREEQARRDEEQQRRDNELRMMFAAMQQGGYGQAPFQYDDMRSMLAETMQALLPAAMQQMQALPPAQSDPNAYAQPGYGAQGYSAPADNARSQREDMLLERLERQEQLINQLLQNQQAQQSAPAYDYEEEPADDVSWLGENDEVVSLEESYGALSDEEKRAYYDIGSYIMSKPRTSQNDGRYAVLFKYRGRTLFKLAIKEGAPVLYYPLNGGRGEVRIADPASLETAKSMIDRSISTVDSELN